MRTEGADWTWTGTRWICALCGHNFPECLMREGICTREVVPAEEVEAMKLRAANRKPRRRICFYCARNPPGCQHGCAEAAE